VDVDANMVHGWSLPFCGVDRGVLVWGSLGHHVKREASRFIPSILTLRTFGPALSPFNAWLLLQGLETLPVRMERHCANALAVAKFLKQHPRVSWVNYPGLPDNKYYKLAHKYLPKGASGLLNFGVKGGAGAGIKFIEAATFMSHLANIGDAKPLIIHPASTTHRQMSEEEQARAGVTSDMVRISVGLETLDDILWDIDQALEKTGS
jgi:O-acetylhomoserine (thiol)-lyase